VVGLALALGACVTAEPPPVQKAVAPMLVPVRSVPAAAQSKIVAKPEQVAAVPAAPAKVAVVKPPAAAVAPAPKKPPVAAPEPAVSLEDLVGLQRTAVADLFGPPGLLRREPPGEVWQYRRRGCVLHVFLYEAAESGQRVEHVEISLPEAMAARACLKTFLRAQASVPGVPRYASSLAP
jgi:hypothetical protein|tara:strand:+ start:287 stop:823 length:537 start_codon:yes stop_codon:yes gene_type:complete